MTEDATFYHYTDDFDTSTIGASATITSAVGTLYIKYSTNDGSITSTGVEWIEAEPEDDD